MNRYPVDEKKIKNDGLSSKLGSIPFVQNISEAITRSFGSAVENFYNPLLSQVTGVSPKETPAGIGVTEYIPINKIVRELTDYNNINDLSKAGEIQLNVTAQEVENIFKSYKRNSPSVVTDQYDIEAEDIQKLDVNPDDLINVQNTRKDLAGRGYHLKDTVDNLGIDQEVWIKPTIVGLPETLTVNGSELANQIRQINSDEPNHGLLGLTTQLGADIAAFASTARIGSKSKTGELLPYDVTKQKQPGTSDILNNASHAQAAVNTAALIAGVYTRYDVMESIGNETTTFDKVANAIEFGALPNVSHGGGFGSAATGILTSMFTKRLGQYVRAVGRVFSPDDVVFKDLSKHGIAMLDHNPTMNKGLITEDSVRFRKEAVKSFAIPRNNEELDVVMNTLANQSQKKYGDSNHLFRVGTVKGISQTQADKLYNSDFSPHGYRDFKVSDNPVINTSDNFSLNRNFSLLVDLTRGVDSKLFRKELDVEPSDRAIMQGLGTLGYIKKQDAFKIGDSKDPNSLLGFIAKEPGKRNIVISKVGRNVNSLNIPNEEINALQLVPFLEELKSQGQTTILVSDLEEHLSYFTAVHRIGIENDVHSEQFNILRNGSSTGQAFTQPAKVIYSKVNAAGLPEDNVYKRLNIRSVDPPREFVVHNEHYENIDGAPQSFARAKAVEPEYDLSRIGDQGWEVDQPLPTEKEIYDLYQNKEIMIRGGDTPNAVVSDRTTAAFTFIRLDFIKDINGRTMTKVSEYQNETMTEIQTNGVFNRKNLFVWMNQDALSPSQPFRNKNNDHLLLSKLKKSEILEEGVPTIGFQISPHDPKLSNLAKDLNNRNNPLNEIIELFKNDERFILRNESTEPNNNVLKELFFDVEDDYADGLVLQIITKPNDTSSVPILNIFYAEDKVRNGIVGDVLSKYINPSLSPRYINRRPAEYLQPDSPFHVVQNKKTGKWGIYDQSTNTSRKPIMMEEYDTDLDAARVIDYYMRTTASEGGSYSIKTIPTFLNSVKNWMYPEMRKTLFTLANEDAPEVFPWSSSNEYFIRYPKTGMGLNPEGLYGSKLLGDYRDGNFVEALRDVVTTQFKSEYSADWTKSDTKKLEEIVEARINYLILPKDELIKMDQKANKGLERLIEKHASIDPFIDTLFHGYTSSSILQRSNKLKEYIKVFTEDWQKGKKGLDGNPLVDKNAVPDQDVLKYLSRNLDHAPYKLEYPAGYSKEIRNALESINGDDLIDHWETEQIAKQRGSKDLFIDYFGEGDEILDEVTLIPEVEADLNLMFTRDVRKRLHAITYETSFAEETTGGLVNEIPTVGYSFSLLKQYAETALQKNFYASREEIPQLLNKLKFIDNPMKKLKGTQEVIDAMKEAGELDEYAAESQALSIGSYFELFGLDSAKLKSDPQLVLNAITKMALEIQERKGVISKQVIDDTVGNTDLIKIVENNEMPFTTRNHAINFNHPDLHDGKGNLTEWAKSKGITVKPQYEHSAQNVLQATSRVESREFQINNQVKNGGSVLGLTEFHTDGSFVVKATKSADFNVLYHEIGHVIRRNLTDDELNIAGEFVHGKQQWQNLSNKVAWTYENEEIFADAFETYLRSGYAKTPEIKGIFEKFKQWIIDLYRAIKGTPTEENLSPKLKEFLDTIVVPYIPSENKIRNNLPEQLHDAAFNYYGIRENTVRVADSGNGKNITRVFKTAGEDSPEIQPPMRQLSPLTTIEETIATNLRDPNKLMLIPGIKQIIGAANPSAIANDPLKKSLIALKMLEEEGKQLAEIEFSELSKIGTQARVFGNLDDAGRLQGTLKGFNVNDIRANPSDSRWVNLLTGTQRKWIDVANSKDEAKLAMFKAEGIDINTLEVEEGGFYAGRRVMGKMLTDGELVDVAVIGGPSKPGMKTAQEKKRFFESEEEGIEAGYRYLDDDETLLINIVGAYRRAAQKRFVDYVTNNVAYTRTTGVPDAIIAQRALATKRYETAKTLIDELQRAKRGGSISAPTKTMIENVLPEVEGMLDDVSKISLQQLVKAGKVAADQPVTLVPRKGLIKALFRKVQELETEIEILKENGHAVPSETIKKLNNMKSKLGFQKYVVSQAFENFKETGNFEYTFEKSATSILVADRIGAIDQLLEVVRGKSPYVSALKIDPKALKKSGDIKLQKGSLKIKYTNGLIDKLRDEKYLADGVFMEFKDELNAAKLQEGSLAGSIPAFSGKIFTKNQPTNLGTIVDSNGNPRAINGQDVANIIGKSLIDDNEFYKVISGLNVINSASRYFQLAGDASLFGIQLAFLYGHSVKHPTFMPKVMKGFINAIIDPEYHAKLINNNQELLLKNRGVLLSIQGTEFTDFARQMTRGGFVRAKPVRIARDTVGQVPGVQRVGQGYLWAFRSSQRAFESAMDTAGIEMLKAFDHAGTNRYDDPVARQELADFINEFRGLANPRRLGISTKQKQLESFSLLAPRYNRAIAAMITDLGRLNMRGKLARQTMASGLAAISAMAVAISIALGEDVDEIADHFNPHSSQFMTWNVYGQQIGFGTKVRSLIKLASSIYVTVADDEVVDLFSLSMDNPMVRFARGNMAPVLGDTVSILSGRSYMGDPIFGDSPFDLVGHIKNFSSEILLPKTMPIWAQSVVKEDGNAPQRVTRGLAEFSGGRAYPEGSWQIMNNYSQDIIGIPYDELEPFERKLLRDLLSDQLNPIMQDRIHKGDTDALYWQQLDQLDIERQEAEMKLLSAFHNLREHPEFGRNPRFTLKQEFDKIQNTYSLNRAALNKQFGKYQDDTEYDKDNPGQHVLNEWYELYDKAVNPNSGIFDFNRLEQLQNNFWTRRTPDGKLFNSFSNYIIRNISNTQHHEGFYNLLPKSTVDRWVMSEQARREFLKNRGNWASVLDNR